MIDFIAANRQDDMTLLITQDNKNEQITVDGGNERLLEVSSYTAQELKVKTLEQILDNKTIDIINDHLDYQDEVYHIGAILAKVRNCKILTRQNKFINTKVKVFEITAQPNLLSFQLLMREYNLFDQFIQYRSTVFNDTALPEGDIMDKASIIQEINVLQQFHTLYGSESLIGIITIGDDNLPKLAQELRKGIRNYDLIGCIDDNTLLFILFNCQQPSFKDITDRIYKRLQQALGVSLKMRYTNIAEYQIFMEAQHINL